MSTNTTLLLSAVILGAAIITATVIAQDDESGPSADTRATAPRAGTDVTPEPGLHAVDTDDRVARLERELELARDQIERLSAASGEATPEPGPRSAADHAALRDRFLVLNQSYRNGTATKAEAAELLRMTKDGTFMARVASGLEAHIADNPGDLDARMQLVDVESARLHSAGSITERTMLATGIRDQIDAVLETDPNHWRARYSRAVGISHSQRTPQGRAAAARAFNDLIDIQEAQPVEERFASTYTQLAGVYMADQKNAEARAALTAGLERHPDSQEIKDLLAKLDADG